MSTPLCRVTSWTSCSVSPPPPSRWTYSWAVDVFLDLHLTNLTPHLVTFKVKTTARDRYLLKPTQDYIPPHGVKTCKIVISSLSSFPDPSNAKNLKDKFLVQSTPLSSDVPDLGRYWKEREAASLPQGRSLRLR